MTPSVMSARPPGRPLEFDVDQVLDRAIEVFRELGFEATSMADLERATGLNKSSIYNTFGSKELIYRSSLDRYERVRLTAIRDVLAAGTAGLDDVHSALDLQQAECESDWGVRGCLAVNSMTELGPRVPEVRTLASGFRSSLAELIRMPLERAATLGEMREDHVPEAVALLVSLTLGVGVLMRAGASHAELAAHFAAAHAAVESWRPR